MAFSKIRLTLESEGKALRDQSSSRSDEAHELCIPALEDALRECQLYGKTGPHTKCPPETNDHQSSIRHSDAKLKHRANLEDGPLASAFSLDVAKLLVSTGTCYDGHLPEFQALPAPLTHWIELQNSGSSLGVMYLLVALS